MTATSNESSAGMEVSINRPDEVAKASPDPAAQDITAASDMAFLLFGQEKKKWAI